MYLQRNRLRGMHPRKFGEFKAEIGARCNINSLKNTLSLSTIHDFKFCGIVTTNHTTKLSLLVHVDTDAGSHVGKISDVAKTTTQVTPNWFNLSNTEKYRVHESKDIEGHLLGREHANSMHFNPLSNQFHIGLVHESGATSPPKG